MKTCIFCNIVQGAKEASIVHEDEQCMVFMDILPMRKGQALVIPKVHVDHFTDVPDELAAHLMIVAQKTGRSILKNIEPEAERIGYVVHGYGVAHAHLVIVPQHAPDDITSMRVVDVREGKPVENFSKIQMPSRKELDECAKLIRLK